MLAGRGKLKIRAPRKGVNGAGDDFDFQKIWEDVSTALRQMHTKNSSTLSFEEIYRQAYKVVLRKHGEPFYERYRSFEEDWLCQEVKPLLLQVMPTPAQFDSQNASSLANNSSERRHVSEQFLNALKQQWEDHQTVMNMATDVFMYLDRVYCKDEHKPSVYLCGMIQFQKSILRSNTFPEQPPMLDILKRIILDLVAMERDGDIVDKNKIKSCVTMLESLYDKDEDETTKLYLTFFEEDFLEISRSFYKAEAERLITLGDTQTYFRTAKKRLEEEKDRCRSTLSKTTEPKIESVVLEELVNVRLKEVLNLDAGVDHMLDHDMIEALQLTFEINALVDSKKEELTMSIQRRIQEMGNNINENASRAAQPPATGTEKDAKAEGGETKPPTNFQMVAAIQWVDDFLKLKDKYDTLWRQSFNSDTVVQTALNQALKETINSFPRGSEFISLFIDENMKKGLKDKTEAEVDRVLEKAIVLLRYVQDRDLFERYYKKHLCKRLLMGKSVSMDVEKQMISRMKIELGNSFTAKLEAMFKDMAVSEELTNGFRNRMLNSEPKRVELSINVLTSMTWPLETMQTLSNDEEKRSQCIFPTNIERIRDHFEKFYAQKHQGRKLTWMANMGTADIRATFPAVPGKEGVLSRERRYELNVSTYAMTVLLLFNELPSGASLTFDEIQAQTNIGTSELIRCLQSVAVAPKTRVLIKEPMSKDVKNNDRFTFNESFVSKYLKLKIGVVAAGNKVEGERERRETEKKNDDSRGFAIEAAVVRIMKQRKQLTHQNVVAETLTQLASQFKPDVTMIKKRIESLIDREYLERVEEESLPTYRYLA